MWGEIILELLSINIYTYQFYNICVRTGCYRGADKSLARPIRKQIRKHNRRRARFQQHRDASCHQVTKDIHAILTETLACFFLGRAKDLSAHQYIDQSDEHVLFVLWLPVGGNSVSKHVGNF